MKNKYIYFHIPDVGDKEIKSIVSTIKTGWITSGPKVREFEEMFKNYIGCKRAVALNSGTAALHLALEAIGVSEGDEVIIPTMTFAATAEVVIMQRAKPILVDCCKDTLNIDHSKIEKAITERTKAIIPVHYGGHPCEMDVIMEIAKKNKIKVIEDAAHAIPSQYKKVNVGCIGDITCFSFYATKTITTGEGGMITTNSKKYSEHIRMMSLHGISKDAWNRYAEKGKWFYEIKYPGYKYNLTDIAAAIGVVQLKKCEKMWERRSYIAERYSKEMKEVEEIELPNKMKDIKHAWHIYPIRLNEDKIKINRDEFIEEMQKRKIGVSVHFIPIHIHPYYRKKYKYKKNDFPVAYKEYKRMISIPIYSKMNGKDVDNVIKAIKDIVIKNKR